MKPASDLTDEQLNIAICEWLRWKEIRKDVNATPSMGQPFPYIGFHDIFGYRTLPNHVTGVEALGHLHAATYDLKYEIRQRIVMELHKFYGAGYITDSHWASPRRWAEAIYTVINQGDSK